MPFSRGSPDVTRIGGIFFEISRKDGIIDNYVKDFDMQFDDFF